MQVDQARREYVLDAAVSAGKFTADRRAHYRALYDRDPLGSERVLAMLVPAATPSPPYPHEELFPELARLPVHLRVPSTADAGAAAAFAAPPVARRAPAPATREQVAAWTRELFPEVAAAGAAVGRITLAND